MVVSRKTKRVLVWIGLITLFGALVCVAADQLLNRTNDNASQAAVQGANLEMASIESTTVKPEKKANVNWTQIQQYERQLRQNTNQYTSLVTKANQEKNADGAVTASTRQAGESSAQEFNQISEQLAAAWEKGNCITRAKNVRAAGKARLANAEMAFNAIDNNAISNYNKQSALMADANAESMKEIKEDASPEDISKLKANLVPQLNKLISDNANLMKQVGELLNEVRQAAGGDVSAMTGCAKSIMTGAADGPSGLLHPVMSLLDLVKGMGSNMTTMLTTVTAL